MAKAQEQVKSIMAQIDAIMTMLERHELSLDIFDDLTISLSPLEVLLTILHHCGLTYDEIVDWLAQYIVYVTPILEIALKGILLAKLKSNVDCNIDPRIPKYLREEIGGVTSLPLVDALTGNGKRHIVINNVKYDVVNNVVVYGNVEYEVVKNSSNKDVVIIPFESGGGSVEDVEFIVYNENETLENGIEIDLSSIDYNGMLNNSPMSERSQYLYFGTKKYYEIEGLEKKFYAYDEIVKHCLKNGKSTDFIKKHSEIDSVYELVRAKDMNAFLWFVMHKAKFLNISDISDKVILQGGKSILKVITGETNASEGGVSVGGCYTQMVGSNKYSVMGLCIKNTPSYSQNGKESATDNVNLNKVSDGDIGLNIHQKQNNITNYSYTIVPTTNVWNGCNWYVNRSLYFDFWDKQQRDYDKEFALFRLSMKDVDGVMTNKLHFTIKPAPNVIVPTIDFDIHGKKTDGDKWLNIKYTGDMPWSFHRIVFDVNGKQDFWGKYSVVIKEGIPESEGQYLKYGLRNPTTGDELNGIYLYCNKKTREYKLEVSGMEDVRSALYECYPGFTVYEFNYDFIMGMRFFDATVITAQLIQALTNIALNIGVNGGLYFNKETSDYKMRIAEITKKMLETNGYESTDCFYTFSNDTYNRMQEESELKRAQLYPFNDESQRAVPVSNADVYSVLNEFDSEASLEQNISVISRAITNASATISNEVMPEDKYSCEMEFIMKAIEMIVSVFVEALLSPKLLMVFAINQKIMGEEMPKDINFEKLLETFIGVIISMIDEIINMLLKKLLDFVLEKVKLLLAAAAKLLLLEQVEYYMRLLRQMIENCAFKLPKSKLLNSTLDDVDYADIDANDTPVTNEC